jgi:bisphosphoglycerate-dependent phosphoglycerate mutase
MRPSESGRITFKALCYLAFIAAVIYAGIKVIPVYVNNYQLQDYIQSQTPYWLAQRAPAEGIQKAILVEAENLSLPVTAEEVTVEANQNIVRVKIDYNVPVDLKVYTLQLHFTPSSENRSLI